MEIFLLFSILVVPVVLLASPATIFTLKGRPDVARLYLICLFLIQVAVILSYWGNMDVAASWTMILVGTSQLLGSIFTWHKTRELYWLNTSLVCLLSNATLIAIGSKFANLSL